MATTTTSSQVGITGAPLPASRALRPVLGATVSALLLNLLAFALGSAGSGELVVTPPGAAASTSVSAGNVAAMTIAPMVLGGIALAVAGRWGGRGWRVVAWLGLAIGLLSVVMPFSVAATASTHVTLGTMHVLSGLAWFVAVRVGLALGSGAAS